MTRWGTWLEGAAAPAAGARFEAVNKGSPGPAWKNRPVVTAAYPRTAATDRASAATCRTFRTRKSRESGARLTGTTILTPCPPDGSGDSSVPAG